MFWSTVAGLALGLVIALLLPPISIHRNRRRAKDAGALWAGLAHFEALDPGTDSTVRAALAGIGSLYFSPSDLPRPVGGLLYVAASGLRWEPHIWLGRGKAQPWSLPCESVVDLELRKKPFPALRTHEALLRTAQGSASFIVVDPRGLEAAVSTMLASRTVQ